MLFNNCPIVGLDLIDAIHISLYTVIGKDRVCLHEFDRFHFSGSECERSSIGMIFFIFERRDSHLSHRFDDLVLLSREEVHLPSRDIARVVECIFYHHDSLILAIVVLRMPAPELRICICHRTLWSNRVLRDSDRIDKRLER